MSSQQAEQLIAHIQLHPSPNLYLSSLSLTKLPDSLLKQTFIEYLDLSNNNLKTLPESIQSLNSLKFLDLSNNSITTLPINILLNLSNLEELRVFGNPLQGIQKKLQIKTNSIQPVLEETLYSCMDEDEDNDDEQEKDEKTLNTIQNKQNAEKNSPDKPSWFQDLQEQSVTSKVEKYKDQIEQFKITLPQLISKLQMLRLSFEECSIQLQNEQQIIQIDPALHKDILIDSSEIVFIEKENKQVEGKYHGLEVRLTSYPNSVTYSQEFANIVTIMGTIRHPNILLFVGIFQKSEQFFIVEESTILYISIYDLLYSSNPNAKKMKVSLNLETTITILQQVASAINYLNSRKIIYNNICSQNILINANFQIKLNNFSRSISTVNYYPFYFNNFKEQQGCQPFAEFEGNQAYLSPEFIQNKKINEGTDVFGFGAFIWELFEKQEPFSSSQNNQQNIQQKVPSKEQLPKISHNMLNQLILNCRQPNKAKRPTFTLICKELENIA